MDALARLGRKIGSEKQIDTDTLNDYLEEAKDIINLFLNVEQFNDAFASKAVEIAAILYEKDETDKHVKSESYSEGVVSENTTYLTSDSFDVQIDGVLNSLKRYRRVYVKHKKKDSTEAAE
jgi:hypothetical protein